VSPSADPAVAGRLGGPTLMAGEPDRRWFAGLSATVVGLALLARVGALLAHHALGRLLGYDDGVYFSAAQHLVAGQLPYRDFVLPQPPGIVLLLAPVAALSHLAGDRHAFMIARLLFALIGVLNTALLIAILARRQRLVALAAGSLYALWQTTLVVERSILLEPVITLGLLVALWFVERDEPRPWLAGLALGTALAFKVWVAPEIVVIAIVLAARGLRGAPLRAFTIGAVAAASALMAPFFVAAPADMWRQVITAQQGRPRSVSLVERLRLSTGLGGYAGHLSTLAIVAMTLAFAAVIVGVRRAAPWTGIWLALLAVQAAELGVAPTFFNGYSEVMAPSIVTFAATALWLAARKIGAGPSRARVAAGVAVMVAPVLVLLPGAFNAGGTVIDEQALHALLARHRCTISDYPSLLALGNVEHAQIDHGCPNWVDGLGVDLSEGDEAWQSSMRQQLAAGDSAVFERRPGSWPVTWSPATRALFSARYQPVGGTGFTSWTTSGQAPSSQPPSSQLPPRPPPS
jgi:alpha-1,2-mannosyltransferase